MTGFTIQCPSRSSANVKSNINIYSELHSKSKEKGTKYLNAISSNNVVYIKSRDVSTEYLIDKEAGK